MNTIDPTTPMALLAIQRLCGLCYARPGEPCHTDQPETMHWFRTLGTTS